MEFPQRDPFQTMCLLEKVMSETLLPLLYLFPKDIIDDVICLINSYTMFTLDYGDIEELKFLDPFVSYNKIVYTIIGLLFQRSFIFCCHEDIIF